MHDHFLIRAPIDEVWAFLMDPYQVVVCMPGAHLEGVESERAFLGSIKIAVGPFATSYKGRVEFAEVDPTSHRVRLVAQGRERHGGDAHGSMVSSLAAVVDGTEVMVDVSVEGTTKLVHLGLGLTEDLGHELFAQFVACVKARLEAPGSPELRRDAGASAGRASPRESVHAALRPKTRPEVLDAAQVGWLSPALSGTMITIPNPNNRATFTACIAAQRVSGGSSLRFGRGNPGAETNARPV